MCIVIFQENIPGKKIQKNHTIQAQYSTNMSVQISGLQWLVFVCDLRSLPHGDVLVCDFGIFCSYLLFGALVYFSEANTCFLNSLVSLHAHLHRTKFLIVIFV